MMWRIIKSTYIMMKIVTDSSLTWIVRYFPLSDPLNLLLYDLICFCYDVNIFL